MQKPKLLIIRPSLDNLSNHFKDVGFYNRERGLQNFFVVVVSENKFDLKAEINEHNPDLIAFMIDPCSQGGKLILKNINYRTDIPRILIPISDFYALYRWNVYHLFKQTKAKAIFAYDTSLGMYYPSLVTHTYQWHEFVDTEIFKDFRLPKLYDVILTGSFKAKNYPWRRKILPRIQKFNCFELVHWNRDRPESMKDSLVKEDFSRQINQAKIGPTCGGHGSILIGKHLEIPASYTCLITEKTEAVLSFGYLDGVNCIFADENNIEEKIDKLLANPDLLETITRNGYDFIRNNHTAQNRSEIYDWFLLDKTKQPDQKIIQTSLLKGIKLVPKNSSEKNYFVSEVFALGSTAKGDKFLIQGDYRKANEFYTIFDDIDLDSSNVVIRSAIICAFKGDLKKGFSWFTKVVEQELTVGKASITDPIELFVFCILLYKKGEFKRVNELCRYAKSCLDELDSNSLHLDIIHSLAVYKMNSVKVGLPIPLNNYVFCSSHELLNLSVDGISDFLKTILKLNKKEVLFLTELKTLVPQRQEEQKNLLINTREDLIASMNTFIFSPTILQKITYKIKTLSGSSKK